MDLNIPTIVENLIVFLAGSATLWVFSKTYKNSKDIRFAYERIRNLEGLINNKKGDNHGK